MSERPIFLRIFSGPHLGATVALPPGGHVLGTDDSCDIILHGGELAPRHALLEVAAAEDGTHDVGILPLDGPVKPGYGMPPLPDKAGIVEGEAFILGATVLAWAEDDTDEAWTAVVERLRSLLAPPPGPERADRKDEETPPDPQENAQENPSDGDDVPEDPAGDVPDEDDGRHAANRGDASAEDADEVATDANEVGTPGTDVGTPITARRSWKTWAAAATVLAACGAMAVGLRTGTSVPPDDAAFLDGILLRQGFGGVRAVKDGNAVAVVGSVRDDTQRGRLVQLARHLHFPVDIDVRVDGDLAAAVRQSFNSRGIFPGVASDGRTLEIAGYAKDELIEGWALDRVKEDVPALAREGAVDLRRRILHSSDVAPILGQALNEAGLGRVGIVWLPGRIRLEASLTADQRTLLDDVVGGVQARLGVPVEFDVETGNPSGLKDEGKAVQPNGFTFNVTAAMTMPMPFVCLDTGEKVFIGGTLPGGYTLAAVDVRTLTLLKDGKTTLYHLRGAQ